MSLPKLVIVGAVRTPIGAIGGTLAPIQARPLASTIIKALFDKTGVDPALVQYTTMGWVMQDPRATNLAKVAAEFAGVPPTSPGTTYHENCNSGGAAIHALARRLLLGEIDLGVAGGVESMSNVARYLFAGRLKGQMFGDQKLVDGLFGALTDPNVGKKGELMGLLTERLAERYEVSREQQDEIAWRSHHNALKAWDEGWFDDEYIIPIEVPQRRGPAVVFSRDEGPRPLTREKLAAAKPYFKPDGGTVTSKNASSVNDAAAAILLTTEARAEELGLEPLAELRAFHNVGVHREYMGEGAFKVVPPLLDKAGLTVGDIDYFEINEAFAAVLGGAFRYLDGLRVERVNQWGSGISLGHPVGCTGCRQVVDMVHQLRRRDAAIGVTTRCVGGGIGGGEVIVRM